MSAAREARRRSLSHRIYAATFGLSFVLITVLTFVAAALLQVSVFEDAENEIGREAKVMASALDTVPDDLAYLEGAQLADTRVTLIDASGAVLYDSEVDASELDNHADRPEVVEALETGYGTSRRDSSSLGEVMIYEAVRLENGNVVRLAQARAGYLALLQRFIVPMVGLVLVGAAVAFFVARRVARSLIEPLRQVDLDHPIANIENAYEEMEPMLDRLETQRQELKQQVKVLADNDRMRREFTANVTHELKTPLTTISGYAELISTGMVREEDVPGFASKIYDEAGRMTALVNDILTLSNLDEAEKTESAADVLGSREPIELSQVLDTVCQRLASTAERAGVTLELKAECAQIMGVARLVDELVYNLASNAIRYNCEGGRATLSSGVTSSGEPFVTVEDTGIGIAPENRDKVFERFYCVDKSRSRARGGTGLGLAIVKHAALFHNATIDIDSELGKGTRITVRFPPLKAPDGGAALPLG